MAANGTHDKVNFFAALAATGVALYDRFSVDTSLIVGLAVFVGGFYLSPDLDTVSIPYKRWGWLRWWWIGYQKWLGHRGWGHCPILGTVSRLVWTLPYWFPIVYYLRPPKCYLIAILVGLEISSLVHWWIDVIFAFIPHAQRR